MRARAKLNATLAPDVIWAQFGWPEASYNDLIDPDAADPISGTVALRSHLCEVLKDGGTMSLRRNTARLLPDASEGRDAASKSLEM